MSKPKLAPVGPVTIKQINGRWIAKDAMGIIIRVGEAPAAMALRVGREYQVDVVIEQ